MSTRASPIAPAGTVAAGACWLSLAGCATAVPATGPADTPSMIRNPTAVRKPATAAVPLPLISAGLPIYASSRYSPASYANDGNYATEWRSMGVPATLDLDLSSASAGGLSNIWLVWYNDGTYGYNHRLIGQVGYDNPGAYSILANAAPGGGSPPAAGWVKLADRSDNTLHSYSYYLDFAGYNWVRMQFTASDGSPLNTDIALNLDVYAANTGVTDGWFFDGDSITANCMGHGSVTGENQSRPGTNTVIATPSFGQQVNSLVGNDTPMQENAGMPGFTAAQMIPYLGEWLRHVPSLFVTINLGTNDAAGGVAPASYYSNMQKLAEQVIASGKTPIIPTIPYSPDPTHQANTPRLNAALQKLYAANPTILPVRICMRSS